MVSLVDKYKQKFYGGKISDKDLVIKVLNPKKNLDNLRKINIIKEKENELNKLMIVFEEFFILLNKNNIYKIDLQKLGENSESFLSFVLKYREFIDFLEYAKKMENKKLRTYIIANIYRSIFEINKHLVSSLMKELATYFRDKTEELANNEKHREEINKIINRVLDKKEKYGISDFLFLIELIDKKFNTDYRNTLDNFLNVRLRNFIAHEKVTYQENGILNKSKDELINNSKIIDEIVLTLIFSISFLYNKKGFSWAFYDITKELDISNLLSDTAERIRYMI